MLVLALSTPAAPPAHVDSWIHSPFFSHVSCLLPSISEYFESQEADDLGFTVLNKTMLYYVNYIFI